MPRTEVGKSGWTARLWRTRNGSAAVEFALVLPIVLVTLMTVIEGGRLIYSQAALFFAAQEATRFAIVRDGAVTEAQIRDFARDQLIGMRSSLAVVGVQSPVNATTGTSEYTVEIIYDFWPLIPYTGGDPIRLRARSSGFIAFAPTS